VDRGGPQLLLAIDAVLLLRLLEVDPNAHRARDTQREWRIGPDRGCDIATRLVGSDYEEVKANAFPEFVRWWRDQLVAPTRRMRRGGGALDGPPKPGLINREASLTCNRAKLTCSTGRAWLRSGSINCRCYDPSRRSVRRRCRVAIVSGFSALCAAGSSEQPSAGASAGGQWRHAADCRSADPACPSQQSPRTPRRTAVGSASA
jgi:hypothetical protein